ncbi:MAG: permease [Candidatus Firestonebacteria bacterium]
MLNAFAYWFVYIVLKLKAGSLIGEALNFFIYDTIKIFLLLIVIIFIVSFIRTYFPPEKTRQILGGKKKYTGNIIVSLLGIVTPFCSCSAVPLFLGFVEAGIPLGVTFTFLVASPMINEVALVMLWGLFGWKISLLYIGSGLIIAIISGIVIGMLKVENLLADFVLKNVKNNYCSGPVENPDFKSRILYARGYTLDILKKVWLFVMIGIGLGAWIHGYVPAEFIAKVAGRGNIFAVPIAALIGVPLYSNAAGVMPLVSALTEKGVQMGTALAFMMAVTALSLPEFLILKNVMKVKLIIIYFEILP